MNKENDGEPENNSDMMVVHCFFAYIIVYLHFAIAGYVRNMRTIRKNITPKTGLNKNKPITFETFQ